MEMKTMQVATDLITVAFPEQYQRQMGGIISHSTTAEESVNR